MSRCRVVFPLIPVMSSLLLFIVSLILRVVSRSFSSSSSRPSSVSSSHTSSYPCSSSSSHPSFTSFPLIIIVSPHHRLSPPPHRLSSSSSTLFLFVDPLPVQFAAAGHSLSLGSAGSPPRNVLSSFPLSPSLPPLSVCRRCVFGSSGGRRSDDVGGGCCVGFDIVRGGLGFGGESDERKTGYDKCRSPFVRRTGRASHSLGPPLYFPSPIPRSGKYVPAHIPLERGGAGAAVVRFVHPRALMVEPTSLNRGEGLVSEWLRAVSGEL